MKKHLFTFCMTAAVSLLLCIGMLGTATAKSLYVNRDLNSNSPIRAYDIQVDGCLVFHMDSVPTRYGGAGLAIDTDAKILFVTFEGSGTLDIVDATTLNLLGQVSAPGANNLAGIVVDEDKSKLYTVNRGDTKVYVYDWDSDESKLTLEDTQDLSGANQAYGLALDEVNDLLYLGDLSNMIKVYSTDDWTLKAQIPVTQVPMAVAVDVTGKYVYSGNAYPPYGCTGELVQYNMASTAENTVDIRSLAGGRSDDCVVGIAVDPLTRLVYITTGNLGGTGSDRILTFDSDLNLIACSTGDIGNPTGIVVPGKDISYNPLNLTKDDGIGDEECVYAGSNIQYTVCYDNGANDYSVEGVTLTDSLPPEVVYVSASGTPYYYSDTHSMVWDIGDLSAGDPGTCETVQVTVVSGTPGETELVNSVGIVGTFPGDRVIPTTQNVTTTVCPNTPPVAQCADITVPTETGVCTANASVDAGSYDPDGEPWEIEELPEGPFELGSTEVLLTITDPFGEVDTCSATVTVEDNTPPIVEMGDMLEMWPPNHKYRSFTLSDCVASVTDNCSQSIDPNVAGSIVSIYSDEPEDVKGNGDGKTLDDIVIVSDSEFKLRSERQGKGNGRVYGINFVVADEAGNITEETCLIGVPHDQDGQPPINDGPALGYTVP